MFLLCSYMDSIDRRRSQCCRLYLSRLVGSWSMVGLCMSGLVCMKPSAPIYPHRYPRLFDLSSAAWFNLLYRMAFAAVRHTFSMGLGCEPKSGPAKPGSRRLIRDWRAGMMRGRATGPHPGSASRPSPPLAGEGASASERWCDSRHRWRTEDVDTTNDAGAYLPGPSSAPLPSPPLAGEGGPKGRVRVRHGPRKRTKCESISSAERARPKSSAGRCLLSVTGRKQRRFTPNPDSRDRYPRRASGQPAFAASVSAMMRSASSIVSRGGCQSLPGAASSSFRV